MPSTLKISQARDHSQNPSIIPTQTPIFSTSSQEIDHGEAQIQASVTLPCPPDSGRRWHRCNRSPGRWTALDGLSAPVDGISDEASSGTGKIQPLRTKGLTLPMRVLIHMFPLLRCPAHSPSGKGKVGWDLKTQNSSGAGRVGQLRIEN